MPERGFNVGDRILSKSTDTHSDWCSAFAQVGDYCFVGASAIGRLHLHKAISRDDAFAARSSGAWLAVAVSDGMGSRPRSRYGASYAVEALCGFLLHEVLSQEQCRENIESVSSSESVKQDTPNPEQKTPKKSDTENLDKEISGEDKAAIKSISTAQVSLPNINTVPHILSDCAYGTISWSRSFNQPLTENEQGAIVANSEDKVDIDYEAIMRKAFENVHSGLFNYAQSQECDLKELHCTLIGFLFNTNTGEAVIGHIGDGLTLALQPEAGSQILIDPLIPEEIGATYVITQKDWKNYLTIRKVLSKYNVYYLMTDGVSDDFVYGPPEILNQWAKDIYREVCKSPSLPEASQSLLKYLANSEIKGNFDDRTLALIFLRSMGNQDDKCNT